MSGPQWIASQSWIDALGWTLVHSVWEGIVVALALAIVLRAMRSTSANARYVAALCALMILPVGALVTFDLCDKMGPGPILSAVDAPPAAVRVGTLPVTGDFAFSPPRKLTWGDRLRPALPWLVMIWIAGIVTNGLYQLGGWIVVRRIRGSGIDLDDPCAIATFKELLDRLAISRPVRIARSALVQVPSVIGAFRPIVILPINALTGLATDQLRGLLAHELAHVRRHDYLVNAIQTIVETLLFYHPGVWWISRVIRQERENACDDLAAQVCDRATYAQALASMEKLRQSPQPALAARGGALLPRIRRILGMPDSPSRRVFTSNTVTASILVVVALSVLIYSARTSHAHDATTQPSSPSTQSEGPFAHATDPTADDLVAKAEDYRIGQNDLVQVNIENLQKSGSETTKQARVSETGKITLPLIGEMPASGETEAGLQHAVAAAYEKAGILKNADVSVTIIEARGRTFSILGAVNQPGQYAITKSDFRVLDALVLARDTIVPVKSLFIVRHDPDAPKDKQRIIQIPVDKLRGGDLQYNVVVRPNDLIVVRPPAEYEDPTALRIFQMNGQLEDMDLALRQLSGMLGPNNPRIKAAQEARDLLADQVRQLSAAPPAPGQGVEKQGGQGLAKETTRSVRVVIGIDQLTLEGKPVNPENLKAQLGKIPDRPETVLEIAVASDDVTVGRLNQTLAIGSKFGFKYLSQIGVHPLGSKAGDELPTTQPTGAGPAQNGEYYVGGHVKRTGVYSLTGKEIRLRQAITSAGGFDDPKMGDDTLILLKRKVQGKAIPTYYRWSDLSTPEKDPVLQKDDVIAVGVKDK